MKNKKNTRENYLNLQKNACFIEKWKVGEEDFIDRCYISGVHRKRGLITEYLVNRNGKAEWLSKQEAISLAKQHRLHVTIVHLKNGAEYLRPEHGLRAFKRIA